MLLSLALTILLFGCSSAITSTSGHNKATFDFETTAVQLFSLVRNSQSPKFYVKSKFYIKYRAMSNAGILDPLFGDGLTHQRPELCGQLPAECIEVNLPQPRGWATGPGTETSKMPYKILDIL